MINSHGPHEPNNNSNHAHQRSQEFTPNKQDIFSFLQKEQKFSSSHSPPFFSKSGLSQDIIQVTQAEPDICLEVFYALYHTLWPQIDSQLDFSFKDAWTKFIGSSVFKGSLCPPERLMTERRIRDMKKLLTQNGGENQVFHDLDQTVSSISHLKEKIESFPGQILQKEDIMTSLGLVQEFYLSYRNKVIGLVQAIIEKEQNNISSVSDSDALEDLLEPKAIMMSDIFAQHWAYRISRNKAQKLLSLDSYGRNQKSNLNNPANHRVKALPEEVAEALVFFKANGNPPIQPEKEFMLYSLYRHLQIPVPETALVILTDVFEANPDYFYAVQASEAVIGESPLIASQDPETIFKEEAFSLQVIGALLTNPSDGSFKNFKYNPVYQTFISIDNDLVFKPELTGKDDKKVVNVKSMFYLFSQMDFPIPKSIKTFFTTLDPHLITLSWLQDLSKKNREYQLLFVRLAFQRTRCIYQNLLPQSEVPSLSTCLQKKVQVDSELHSDSFYPQILLSKDLLANFLEKLQMIGKILLTNRPVNIQALFEEISPVLGKYYRKLRFEFSEPEEALEALWGNKKSDIDYSYISSLLDNEEFQNLSSSKKESEESLTPQTFFQEYRDLLISGESPLDKFIRRHNERKKKNLLNLQIAQTELQFLIQEGLTSSQSIREIVDFCHSLSKIADDKPHLMNEIISHLSNIPHPELKWLLILEKYFLRADRSVPKDLTASSAEVLGAFMKKRTFILSESESQYLFDPEGNIKKNTSFTGRSRVTCFPHAHPKFYLKQYPEWPGYEFASILFMRLLGITHLPYQDLLIIKDYPTLLTQKADGNPVVHVWHDPKAFNNLDRFHTGLLIICAMLINPEDGKEDNFILSHDQKYLIPIDNDHCFLPCTLQKEGSVWNAFTVNTALQTKTILFCLDEMYMEVPLEVRQHILSLDFDLLLLKWMTELDKIENKLSNLVDQNQRSKFLEQGTVMRIPFYKQFLQNLHWKAHKIQDLLGRTLQATPFDLLKAVEPFAAKCYEDSFKQGRDLHSRFKAATKDLYKKTSIDGSRMSIINTRTMMEIINVSEKDLQNDTIFQRMGPVDALELLNQLIQERSQKTTMEEEMLHELDEKKQEKKWMNLFGNSPGEAALKAFLANPKEGLILRGSKLISQSRLTELFAQTSNKGMRIRFLSLPESPLLTEKEIRILTAECPNIEYLNVSGCLKLKQFITREGEWAFLSRLEAKDCLNLEIFVSSSPMKILQIGTDQKIEIFVEKSTLDIFTFERKLIKFQFSFKKGESFQLKAPNSMFSSDNFGESFLVSRKWSQIKGCFHHVKITIGMSSISSGEDLAVFVRELNLQNSDVKIEKIQAMIKLNLIYLKRLDLSSNEIHDEGLEILTRGNWTFLEILNLQSTKITAKGIGAIVNQSNWPKLKQLDLSHNRINDEGLSELTCREWPLLEELLIKDTKITANGIDLLVNKNHLPNLKKLDISENAISDEGLKTLVSGNWPFFEHLVYYDTQVTLEGNIALLETFKWTNLRALEHSISGSFYSFNEDLDQWSSKFLLAKSPVYYRRKGGDKQSVLVSVLDMNRLSLKEICLSIKHGRFNEKIIMLSRERLDKYKDFYFSQDLSLNQSLERRLNLKTFDLSEILYKNEKSLQTLSLKELSEKPSNLKCATSHIWDAQDHSRKVLSVEYYVERVKKFSSLESLCLSHTNIKSNGIENLVRTLDYPNLKKLDLNGNKIGDKGLEILVSGKWKILEDLDLGHTEITATGIQALINQSNWPHLKKLKINANKVGDKGLETLASGKWQSLEELSLGETEITARGIQALVSQSNWPHLKKLEIYRNSIGDEGLEILSQGKWPLLEALYLQQVNITHFGIDIMAEISNWPNLKILDISLNRLLLGIGFEALSLGKWPLLECLYIYIYSRTILKDVESFAKNLSWLNLKEIWLDDNNEIDAIQKVIHEKLPNVKIITKDYRTSFYSQISSEALGA